MRETTEAQVAMDHNRRKARANSPMIVLAQPSCLIDNSSNINKTG